MQRFSTTLYLSIVFLILSGFARADVLDPLDNSAAPPGTAVLVSYLSHQHYPDITDSNGDKADLGLDVSSLVIRPVYFIGKIADKVSYGVNAIIPGVHLELDSDNVFGAPSSKTNGLGDIGISPFIYLYENQESQLFISFWEFIFMPTGNYDSDKAINIGRDTWWFQHQLAFGWYPGKFGIDFNINYFQFPESDELKYDEPDALELETVVHYAVTDKLRVGINAAYWQGLDDAEIDGTVLPDSEPMNVKLGLNLSYTVQENITIGLRWMHDVESENSPMGDWIYIKASYAF
jgi:hypothetical protein